MRSEVTHGAVADLFEEFVGHRELQNLLGEPLGVPVRSDRLHGRNQTHGRYGLPVQDKEGGEGVPVERDEEVLRLQRDVTEACLALHEGTENQLLRGDLRRAHRNRWREVQREALP